MHEGPDVDQVAAALLASIGLLLRRLRQLRPTASSRCRRARRWPGWTAAGRHAASALARLEQISPQSMGATLAGLEARGLVERRPDPDDGRRIVLSITGAGRRMLRRPAQRAHRAVGRSALRPGSPAPNCEQLMAAAPLLERLAQSI